MLYNLISTYPDPAAQHIVLYSYTGPVKRMLEERGIQCEQVRLSWKHPWASYKSVYSALKRIQPDVVHALLWMAIFFGRGACYYLQIPFVGVFHSNPAHNGAFRNMLDCLTIGFFPAYYCAVSLSVKNTVRKNILERIPFFMKYRLGKITMEIIPNGIDTNQFVFNEEDRKRIRELLGASESTVVIGAVGRLVPVKRYDWLIEAVSQLKHRMSEREIVLVIIGAGSEFEHLQETAQRLGIAASVKLVGVRNPVNPWYSALDILAISSSSEGMSMALLEAMSAGLPIVTTSTSIEHDVVKRGVHGFVSIPRDQEGFINNLQRLIEEPELRKKIAENNRATARELYDISAVSLRYKALFERIKR